MYCKCTAPISTNHVESGPQHQERLHPGWEAGQAQNLDLWRSGATVRNQEAGHWFSAASCTAWNVGILGAVQACAMCLIHKFKVHSLPLLFSWAFYVYPLLFCSLQYIYQSLYSSYPSICLWTSQRQLEIPFSFYLDHIHLLIWFQHEISKKIISSESLRIGWLSENI